MGFLKDLRGRSSRALVGGVVCSVVVLCLSLGMAQAQTVVIDLDRSTTAIDATFGHNPSGGVVQGRVVLTGVDAQDTLGPAYGVAVNVAGMPFTAAASSLGLGDASGGGTSPYLAPAGNQFFFSYVGTVVIPGPASGQFTLFTFDLEFGDCNQGAEVATFSFLPTSQGSGQVGIGLNGGTAGVIDGGPPALATEGATLICGSVNITPTVPPREPCEDAGYYILDSFGGRHRVGNPAFITGPLYYGRQVAEDMERVTSGATAPQPDLAVLDSFGAVQFVQNPAQVPSQGFYFPEGATPTCGLAVDVEVTADSQGFWVLTEQGGIYRAGTALPGAAPAGDPLGNDAGNLCSVLGIPVPNRDPNLPQSDPTASLRAVGFVVVEGADASNPDGYVVLDSMGGHHIFDGAGNTRDDDIVASILNGPGGSTETVYPFFVGLDIARDIELHPSIMVENGVAKSHHLSGLVIYDGWGGIHPVPVDPGSPVDFLRNEGPGATTVGLPYIKDGFDNPDTAIVETNDALYGIDSNSIFKDIEFCQTGQDGVYCLDAFGGVFAFGSTRALPNEVGPMFSGGPYFYPNMYAVDLEAETEAGLIK